MRNIKWLLFLFEDKEKTKLYKILDFNTMKDLSYVLGMKNQVVSNYFHNLIKPRDVLNYCYIYQFKIN